MNMSERGRLGGIARNGTTMAQHRRDVEECRGLPGSPSRGYSLRRIPGATLQHRSRPPDHEGSITITIALPAKKELVAPGAKGLTNIGIAVEEVA